jgi:PAS domain S-box-containing protein
VLDTRDPKPAWNEQDRLKAIEAYDILDTPKEEEFNDIVRMAAEACNVPVSLITFIASDRQWFKAATGTAMTETPLDVSICSHAIRQDDLFVVPDATEDERFTNNPLVKGDPNIRFYAGALLKTPDGLPLGTVCVLDFKPRTLSDKEVSTLKALARQVMTQLELRRALGELRRALKAKSKSEQSLGEAAAKFRALFDQSSVFAGIMTLDGIVIEANSLCTDGCGYRADDVLNRPFWEGPWWRGSKEVQQKIRDGTKQAARGYPYTETLPFKVADDSERVVDFAIHPIRNEAGEVIFLHPTGMDVTERHQAQARIEFLGQLTQKLSMVSDPDEINRVATREIGQFLGVDRCYFFQPLPGLEKVRLLSDWHRENERDIEGVYQIEDFGPPEWATAFQREGVCINDVETHPWTRIHLASYRAIRIGAYIQTPFVHEGKWVACITVSSHQPRVWTSNEKVLLENAVARAWPLIERARTEVALRESEQRFRAMSDNIAPLAWMAHADGKLFWYNKRWYDFTGGTLETMRGDGWAQSHDPEHLPHVIESWKKAVLEGTRWEDTFPLRRFDGQYRWFLSRAYPIRDDKGSITLWFGVNTDVTELRETQEALRAANAQLGDKATHLEALVQQRTQKLSETIGELEAFSYSISHDMRAPLRAMIGFSELIQEDYAAKLDATGIDYLNRICKASRRMDRLIQDVLSFSRLSRQDVDLETIDTDALVREIIHSYPNFHSESVDIVVKAPLPAVLGSEALLTQCFSNLMENGSKFTKPGTRAKVEIWGEASGGRVKIFFKDNGIGISEHNLKRIFEIFHRVGRDNEGTGIGLAIVRKSTEKMGGTVDVQSELGKGSLFWLDLLSATA